jgi:RNA polymerase sigma-70 factor (ECF subfamily)
MTLEELFEQHHAGLFRFIARMTNDPEFAQDIVQETFVCIASRPWPEEANHMSRAWVFQLARNLARSGLRKRSRRSRLLTGWTDDVPVARPGPLPDVDAARAEARAAVRRALAQLSEKERTILLMREEGFTHREIAQAVGTTTGSIGTMFVRALAKLESGLDAAWREAL